MLIQWSFRSLCQVLHDPEIQTEMVHSGGQGQLPDWAIESYHRIPNHLCPYMLQCCRDSTGLVPQIHLTTGLGYHNLVCSCVCECVDVCARMFHQLVFISHSFGAWFWTETQLPDVCCRFFRPVSTQPKRKRLRLMYQSDKEHCARHIWYSSQLVTSHSIAVITVTRIHSCNPNGLSRK